MRNFLLISFFLFLFSCNTNPYKKTKALNEVEVLTEDLHNPFDLGESLLFKAKVSVYKHYLSGLLLVKEKEGGRRVVFTSEMGIKFFDFEYRPDTFIVHYCMDKLNKGPVLATLEEDLGMAILNNVAPRKYSLVRTDPLLYRFIEGEEFYFYTIVDKKVQKIENTTDKKQKVVVTFDRYDGDIPFKIIIHHYDIKLDIELNYIKR